jgi:2-methylcitrate dehydratase PrpD
MSAITDLADFLTQRPPLSDAMRQAVGLHVIDTVGALVAATRTAEGQMLLRLRAPAGSAKDISADVMTLCALTRMTEIDDIHLASMTTPSSIVIPGALVIATAQPRQDAEALVDAIAAGYEAMIRLGWQIPYSCSGRPPATSDGPRLRREKPALCRNCPP